MKPFPQTSQVCGLSPAYGSNEYHVSDRIRYTTGTKGNMLLKLFKHTFLMHLNG